MDLKVAFSKAEKSNLTNYKGEQLLVHSVLIIDEDLSNDDELYIIHQWDSTFKPEWKDRDIAEATNKAQAMIKSILATGEIGYRLEPKNLTMIVDDQYENDCKVYQV
ncbi:hypothetical protein LJ601_002208 [Acinetobacter baumannii]|uniref:hypothetical protein n=1 Tax=Acinetobacter sp. SwsAc5 TaxID=2749438 RepID=UPI0015BC1135|nr:hypothetical protein [Acinetobacter sp. SwsAc5]EKV2617706.1 hypothetical protein [Acinetobacter baumannii]NWK53180.1 hypothetical protein [Acinetobacter sp. SwsAc5]